MGWLNFVDIENDQPREEASKKKKNIKKIEVKYLCKKSSINFLNKKIQFSN